MDDSIFCNVVGPKTTQSLGRYVARHHCIDGYPRRRKLDGRCANEAELAGFARAIV
jgi:hypothetical protein